MWRNFLQTNGRLKHFFLCIFAQILHNYWPDDILKSTWSGTRKDISISLQSISITVELTSQYNDWISIIFACQGQALRNQLKTLVKYTLRTNPCQINFFEHVATIFIQILTPSMVTRGLHRCWWRMLETKCVGDKFKMLRTDHHHKVTNITMSPTSLSPTRGHGYDGDFMMVTGLRC